ncbi:RNA polymerase sigma-70 factor (ECF subfamily) [Actinoplanes lutulentus]|uniref:RNA polymerase sigma factor n=1 Tax=Actinoplanes lutulentus TaxID=1287878 RepID=A0A327ZNP0_9ACTN|nr:sigma-70 family RNA polymerase sigma factor [Actinoplanes lutulentus]MBB2940593.1 RNA polymerase sigma-70 factor (ECF subfamily) [Actinoplanes lutulentus]RAK42904.1 RNA polymerase sigma-70 factor (ECF subfamily) [Actinoplanes lutulentus]
MTLVAFTPDIDQESGDDPAARLRRMFETQSEPLMAYLLKLTLGEHHLAEDLLQETFLRAWRRIADLPGEPASARPWLFTVARRAAIDVLRARRARPTEVELIDSGASRSSVDIAEQVVDAHLISTALPKLTPMHREMIIEVYYRDRDPADIAGQLDIPEGTVKSRTFYAVRRLGRALGVTGTTD